MAKVEIIQQKGYNFLWIDDYLWMWDIPAEDAVQRRIAEQVHGDVLIVGYGLGVVHRHIDELVGNGANIASMLTIEKRLDVIDECVRVFGFVYGKVQIADFYEYNTDRKFDCVVGDIWPEINRVALPEYKKFKARAERLLKPDGKILAWGDDYFEYLLEEERRAYVSKTKPIMVTE